MKRSSLATSRSRSSSSASAAASSLSAAARLARARMTACSGLPRHRRRGQARSAAAPSQAPLGPSPAGSRAGAGEILRRSGATALRASRTRSRARRRRRSRAAPRRLPAVIARQLLRFANASLDRRRGYRTLRGGFRVPWRDAPPEEPMIDLRRDGDVFVLRMDAGENRFRPELRDGVERGARRGGEAPRAPKALVTIGSGQVLLERARLDWMLAKARGAVERVPARACSA